MLLAFTTDRFNNNNGPRDRGDRDHNRDHNRDRDSKDRDSKGSNMLLNSLGGVSTNVKHSLKTTEQEMIKKQITDIVDSIKNQEVLQETFQEDFPKLGGGAEGKSAPSKRDDLPEQDNQAEFPTLMSGQGQPEDKLGGLSFPEPVKVVSKGCVPTEGNSLGLDMNLMIGKQRPGEKFQDSAENKAAEEQNTIGDLGIKIGKKKPRNKKK